TVEMLMGSILSGAAATQPLTSITASSTDFFIPASRGAESYSGTSEAATIMALIKISDAFKAGADWLSATVRGLHRDQVLTCIDTVQDVRDNDFEQTRFLYVKAKGAFYRLNLSSTASDDGDTVLRDNIGRRYVKVEGTAISA